MSAVDTRMPRPEAIEIARAFVAEIEPYTDQLIVAGSLRRRLALIGDIEIVCVPRVETVSVTTPDLFGGETRDEGIDQLDLHLTMLLDEGRVQHRRKVDGSLMGCGPRMKHFAFQGARVDLFCAVNDWNKEPPRAEPERFGWMLLLRTGPAPFSRQLVVPKLDDRGRPGRTKDQRPGLMPAHLVAEGGWLRYRTSRERIETPDEQSVFDLFKIPYIEPWSRV
jgi:DNA polymerase/3'-5' exonuclease PolX